MDKKLAKFENPEWVDKWIEENVNEFLIENRHEVLLNPFLGLTMFAETIIEKMLEETK